MVGKDEAQEERGPTNQATKMFEVLFGRQFQCTQKFMMNGLVRERDMAIKTILALPSCFWILQRTRLYPLLQHRWSQTIFGPTATANMSSVNRKERSVYLALFENILRVKIIIKLSMIAVFC